MKFVRVDKNRSVEVPETWAEGEKMLAYVMSVGSERGGNLAIQSVCGRVALGLFGEIWMAPDPTTALVYLMQRICQRKGAGLG